MRRTHRAKTVFQVQPRAVLQARNEELSSPLRHLYMTALQATDVTHFLPTSEVTRLRITHRQAHWIPKGMQHVAHNTLHDIEAHRVPHDSSHLWAAQVQLPATERRWVDAL